VRSGGAAAYDEHQTAAKAMKNVIFDSITHHLIKLNEPILCCTEAKRFLNRNRIDSGNAIYTVSV
jgi:hypothetical protein